MGMCVEHWEELKQEIKVRGLGDLIAPDGETAAAQAADQIQRASRGEDPSTPANYDPLMSAYWAILSNAAKFLGEGGNALYIMLDGPEDPIKEFPGHENETWPRCAICYLNLAHKLTCQDPECALDIERGYDWMIERAVVEEETNAAKVREQAKELGDGPPPA